MKDVSERRDEVPERGPSETTEAPAVVIDELRAIVTKLSVKWQQDREALEAERRECGRLREELAAARRDAEVSERVRHDLMRERDSARSDAELFKERALNNEHRALEAEVRAGEAAERAYHAAREADRWHRMKFKHSMTIRQLRKERRVLRAHVQALRADVYETARGPAFTLAGPAGWLP